MLDQTWGRDRQAPAPLVAVNDGPWRLFYSTARPQQSELYKKADDPREQANVFEGHPDVVEALTQAAKEHLEGPPPPWGDDAPTIELDDLQINQLRALGYGVQ